MRRALPSLFRAMAGACALATLAFTALRAEDPLPLPPAGIGATVEAITVKGVTYHGVKLRSVSSSGVVMQHSGGLISVGWQDLPATWRVALASLVPKEKVPTPAANPRTPAGGASKLANANASRPGSQSEAKGFFALIGEPVQPKESVDLRPRMRELGLWIKNQGPQPSCSVHAVLGAIEYQFAEARGAACRFDEQALIRATEDVTKRRRLLEADNPEADAGFTLPEVVLAIRKHGLSVSESWLQQQLTRDPDAAMRAPVGPKVSLHELPGQGDRAQQIADLMHALNAGFPVPVGMAFPSRRAAQNGYLSTQTAEKGSGHAVTLVGYECPSGRIEDTVFIFRNSWGVNWGASGYGRATFEYLRQNLVCAVVLEVQ
ncbi:MAG: C1 family peptidase [Opitutaceae bacterium]|nr:C1 family peptidase [Opitutaceae bacterium]